ncbi:hypothetical protein HG444_001205 [Candidatus Saccharibacteria bacterium]|jgi:hypothetical protein|nr:hypothetical protein [Candidatus Saccharibacteria bacterium]
MTAKKSIEAAAHDNVQTVDYYPNRMTAIISIIAGCALVALTFMVVRPR